MKEDYRMKEQKENFAILKKRINEYLERPTIKDNPFFKQQLSSIQKSLEQIEDALKLCIIRDLNWSRQLELANHYIETDKISKLDWLISSLAIYCE